MPLGGVAPIPSDVRVLAATNRDLASEVGHGRFRQDLFFRLNVVRINIPPLRARMEDVPLLVGRFIEKFNALQGRRINGISERAIAQLLRHDYPGNVRELENAIEHGFVVCGGSVLEREDLPPHIIGEQVAPLELPGVPVQGEMGPLQGAEVLAIREALANHQGVRTLAAKELGISRNTLWRKMKRYEID
jgi:transcriptional regulator with PAS, ATPase and Fis domain